MPRQAYPLPEFNSKHRASSKHRKSRCGHPLPAQAKLASGLPAPMLACGDVQGNLAQTCMRSLHRCRLQTLLQRGLEPPGWLAPKLWA